MECCYQNGSIEIVENVRLVRKQSIRVLIFPDCWFTIHHWKVTECKKFFTLVTRGSGAPVSSSWSLSCFMFVLFSNFFPVVSFVITTLDNFQFQSQKCLSQINVVDPMRLKFIIFAVFIKWKSRIKLLLVGWPDIINYWDFSSHTFKNCQKNLVPKFYWYD